MKKRLLVLAAALCLVSCLAPAGEAKPVDPKVAAEIALDHNKGALYALYARALRDNPNLKGKFTYRFTVEPQGAFSNCRVVSSELQSPDFEAKLCARIELIRMQPVDAPLTLVKSIDFFPAR